jgi:uncharacterized protein YndB with AHSA1/START domain
MNDHEYHYTTYIRTTPEKLWAAITTPEFTRQYWGKANLSDWQPGSRWEHRGDDGVTRVSGTVTEAAPPKKLVLTWAQPGDVDHPERHSRVTFSIDAIADSGGMVCLHVAHDRLVAGSETAQGISLGWPRVLSSLKSFLETGAALDTFAGIVTACHPAKA